MHLNSRRRLMLYAAVCALAALTGLGRATPTAAATFIVGSCSSSTVIADIEAANSEIDNPGGDTIRLKAGCTYLPSDAYGTTTFAFPGIETDIIIEGNGARIQLAAGATAKSLFNVVDGGALLLSDLTLAEGEGGNSQGANIHNRGSVTLQRVTMTHSVPTGQTGPGIYNDRPGVLAVIASTIEGQSNLNGGGGIYNQGSLTVSASTFRGNSGRGAIISSGTAAIYGSTFTQNAATGTGGAINNAGPMEIHDSSFVDNETSSGGAIHNSSNLTVDGSYFASNYAVSEGGAIDNDGSAAVLQITNTTFASNDSHGKFSTCCDGTGGAISNHHELQVDHVTFSRNSAGDGDSIANPGGVASIKASIFAGGGPQCSGTTVDLGWNVIGSGSTGCPSTFTVGDAKLVGPAVHGSGTKTLALGAGSAALDTVPTTGCPTYDQRGVTRPKGPACDAGAFEDQAATVPGAPALTSGTNPNTGSFGLGWSASTDPDGTPVTYRLYHRDADDAAYSLAGTQVGTSLGFTAESEGTMRYVVAADDGNHVSAMSPASAPIVVDRSAPTAPTGAPDRAPDGGGWYRDTVTVTFSGSVDPALQDGSAGSGVASTTAPLTRSTSGTQQVTGSSTDAAGNISPETTTTVKVDADSPLVGFTSCPADVILKSSTSATWSASDGSSGLDGAGTGGVPLDTATIGTRSVQVTAADLVGHQSTATCAYRVIFDFNGFGAPLADPPAIVDFKAGDGVSVSFSLGGDQGLGIFATGFPQSAPVSCAAPGESSSGPATTSQKPLDFARGQGGRYKYLWATQKSWAGTCRQLIVTFTDGTVHRANLRFK